MQVKLLATIAAAVIAASACGSGSLEPPYVEPRSAEDVLDYVDANLRLRLRRVEYEGPIEIPGTTQTTTTTVELYAQEMVARAQVHIGAAIGERILTPVQWGFGWRLVEYEPEMLSEGARVSYGFISHDGPAEPHELERVTTLEYRPNEMLRYRLDP